MGAAGQLKKIWQYVAGGTNPAGAASSSGDIGQMVKYLVANPSTPTWARQVPKNWLSGGDHNSRVNNPVYWAAWWSPGGGPAAPEGNFNSTVHAGASAAMVFDTTEKRYYVRNTTGAQGYFQTGIASSSPLGNPYGADFSRPNFDFNSGGLDMFPPVENDCMVLEWEATFTAASASANNDGIGISVAAFSGTPFDAADRHIAFYRKSGGGGWTLKTADGSTASETSEASDTSDGNKHIFRIEWHDKGTAEVRLYVDGVLKVTKTTNLPATNSATLPTYTGWCKPSGAATDSLRVYGHVMYWKDAE